jgi:cardiolipin synthase
MIAAAPRRGTAMPRRNRPTDRKNVFAIVFASVAATIALVLVVLNVLPQEKQLTRDIRQSSAVDSAQFRNEVSNLLGPPVVDGNRVTDLENGDHIFPAMLGAIRTARRTIDFETYIYWSGQVGETFVTALCERARAGVAVHVLVDWIGGIHMKTSNVERLRAAGAEFEYFHPLHWYTADRLNNRTHRKLLIVDGRVGFTGGVGIADAWLGNAQRPDQWRDMHFQLEGPAVAEMQAVFEDNWITTTGHVLLGPDYYPLPARAGDAAAQLFASSPDGGSENMQLMYLLAIAAARSSIDLEAAYFIPGDLVRKALQDALRRGVKIRIVVPGAHVDSELVDDASQAQWGAMLDAGGKIYRFQPSLFHSKLMIVDRYLTMVGSTNFDERSFRLNDEANLDVYDRAFAEHMGAVFERDVAQSSEITAAEWRKRPWMRRLEDELSSWGGPQL